MLALFVVLELCTNLALEAVLDVGAAGVLQRALPMSVAFWTCLWGPLGLLMATPLTVRPVVLGKHVPGLEFVGDADGRHARARAGAWLRSASARVPIRAKPPIPSTDISVSQSPRSVYDILLPPALNFAERDRLEQRLSQEEEMSRD